MGWQKSAPSTCPFDARLSASARSPVPQQRSTTTEEGFASTRSSDLTVAFRQRMSNPALSRWFSRSYRGATAANMLRTAEAVACSSAFLPTVVPSTLTGFTLTMRLRLLDPAQRLDSKLDGNILNDSDFADPFRHNPVNLSAHGLLVTREEPLDLCGREIANCRQRPDAANER